MGYPVLCPWVSRFVSSVAFSVGVPLWACWVGVPLCPFCVIGWVSRCGPLCRWLCPFCVLGWVSRCGVLCPLRWVSHCVAHCVARGGCPVVRGGCPVVRCGGGSLTVGVPFCVVGVPFCVRFVWVSRCGPCLRWVSRCGVVASLTVGVPWWLVVALGLWVSRGGS